MFTVRAAEPDDEPFLREMLREAARGAPLDDPVVARYIDGWGRPGDLGVVAVGGGPSGAPLGAAWVRLFPGDAPGYGWVGDDVPELAMAVRPSSRGMGFGRTLLTAVLRASRAAGYQRVSLSVDPANTAARRLYDSSGFRATGGSGTSTTMVVDL